jgi:hypothetical protein
MKVRSTRGAIFLAAVALVASACSTDNTQVVSPNNEAPVYRSGDLIEGQYIVVYHDFAVAQKGEDLQAIPQPVRLDLVNKATNRMAESIGVSKENILAVWETALRGSVMRLNNSQLDKLRKDPGVKFIEQDRWIGLPPNETVVVMGKPSGSGNQPAQTTPWGITKVGGAETPSSSVTAWIVDSGIDLDHPDLNVSTSRSRSYVSGSSSADDGNGHGTHTAGTVGAKDNTIGVIGVAPGITLVAMRVLNNAGSGQFSWSISAFNYIAANGTAGDVVNYSVGPGSRYTSTTIDNAVKGVADAGIHICVAAGNSADDCVYYSPACVDYDGVYTIAAMNSSTKWATFSNYGSEVDWICPGVGVKSTYKGGGYATWDGTSMATPHATGMLAVGGIVSGGSVSSVPSGTTTDWGKRD